jgi:hypothetical protein
MCNLSPFKMKEKHIKKLDEINFNSEKLRIILSCENHTWGSILTTSDVGPWGYSLHQYNKSIKRPFLKQFNIPIYLGSNNHCGLGLAKGTRISYVTNQDSNSE